MSEFRFKPVKGIDEQIQSLRYTPGAVYFATDTKKIYLDVDGMRKPMGGNSGIYYGTLKHTITDPSIVEFEFTLNDIDGEEVPNIDDLILNSDGCFYRVINNQSEDFEGNSIIIAKKLTVAGSGGSGGGSSTPGVEDLLEFDAVGSNAVKKTYIYGQSDYIVYKATARKDFEVIYTITIKSSTGQIYTTQESVDSGEEFKFDLGKKLFSGLNNVTIDVFTDNSGTDQKIYRNVNSVEMKLEASNDFNPLNVIEIPVGSTAGGVLEFKCRPVGKDLEKTLTIEVDGTPRSTIKTTDSGKDISVTISGLAHGRHTVKASLTTGEGSLQVATEPLYYEIAVIDPEIKTPVIWLGKYPTEIVEHDNLNIEYMVYNPENPLKADVSYFINQTELPTSVIVSYNKNDPQFGWEVWSVTDYIVGMNELTISSPGATEPVTIKVNVQKDTLRDLNVLTSGLLINLNSKGRSNKENRSSREKWESVNAQGLVTSVKFNNFNWYNNGWITDENKNSCLRISNGASISVPFKVLNTQTLDSGLTFEFEFKLRNVQNLSTLITTTSTEDSDGKVVVNKTIHIEEGVFGRYFNNGCGLCLGTQEAFFKSTGNSIVNARYTDDQIINLTFVVESSSKNKPLMYIYLNGVLSGIANYSTTSDSFEAKVNEFTINSDYCDIDLYKMRVYNQAQLSPIDVVHNYIADKVDANLYDMNQITDFVNNIPKLSFSKMIEYNLKNPDNQTMPYAVVEISQEDADPADERLPFVKGGKRKLDVEFVNPWLDRAYERQDKKDDGSPVLPDLDYMTGCPSFKAVGAQFDVQGTSSQGYPRRNFKGKFKEIKEWVYTNGPAKGQSLLETITIGGKDFKGYYMDNKDASETTFTWKADYMESSGTHNTGFTSFVKTLYSHHPLVDLLGDSYVTGDHRTTIYGFPMMVFQKFHDGTYDFVGKYNFNLDKGCNNVIDFKNGSDHPFVKKEDGTPEKIKNVAQCWEFKNNQGTRCSFKKVDFEELNDKNELTLLSDLEYRYNHDEDMFDDAIDGKEDKFPTRELANQYILKEFSELKKLFVWLDSTNTAKATGETFDAPVVFTATVGGVTTTESFESDTAAYRLAKFKYEFTEHFNPEYCYIYFIMTELILGYDSRGKNMMLASWGPQKEGGEYIWYPIFYDVDTQLGVNNSGVPTWEYDTNATADKQFSTADSVLWNNVWSCFSSAIQSLYVNLRKNALTIEKLNGFYDFNPEISKSYAMMGCRPLNMINVDEYYKYIAPAFTGYLDTSGVTQQTSLYFYCLQGSRELQRELFLRNRFNYIDSQWLAGPYSAEAVGQELKLRYNSNDAAKTSDKFIEEAPDVTDNEDLAKTLQSFYDNDGQIKPYKESPLDGDASFQITPYLKQFVGVYYDAIPTTPVLFNGKDPITVNPTASLQNSIKNTPTFSQQLVYLGGVEYISKFGDLSLKYADEFAMNKAIRLKELYIGNDNEAYDNRAMKDDAFNLGASAFTVDDKGNQIPNPLGKPLLETVVLSNIGSISNPQDLTSCEKLKTLRCLGTSLGGVSLASGTIVETLYLPDTITYFDLIEPLRLNTILTEKPQASAEGEFPKGLYIDGLTNLSEIKDDSVTKINRINITGGNMGYKSFEIVDKVVKIKEKMQQNESLSNLYSKDLRINLDTISWSPYRLVEHGEEIVSSATYAKKTDHYTFESYTPGSSWSADTLNKKIYEVNTEMLANDANLITDLNLLDKFIESYTSNTNYFKSIVSHQDGRNTIPYVSGDLYVANSADKKISETKLKNEYKDLYFPDLNIFVAHAAESYIAKFIEIQESGAEHEWDILKYDPIVGTTATKSEIIPTKLHYDFVGWALKPNATEHEIIVDQYPTIGESEDGTPVLDTTRTRWSDLKFDDDTTIIVLYAVFKRHEYEVQFIHEREVKTLYIPYNDPLREHPEVPYKDDSNLELYETYGFIGYSASADSKDIVDLSQYKATQNYKFYAVVEKMSIYDNISDDKYFKFTALEGQQGFAIGLNPDYHLKGKVTLPVEHEGLPILAINYQGFMPGLVNGEFVSHDITHIFWGSQDQSKIKVKQYGANAFVNALSINYVEIPDSVETIGEHCFDSCNLKQNIHTGKNVKRIDSYGFNSCLEAGEYDTFTIGGSVTTLGSRAVANFKSGVIINTIQFGEPGKACSLSDVVGQSFRVNENDCIRNIEIYYATEEQKTQLEQLIGVGEQYPINIDRLSNININYVLAN